MAWTQAAFVTAVESSLEDLMGVIRGSPLSLSLASVSPAQYATLLVIEWGSFWGGRGQKLNTARPQNPLASSPLNKTLSPLGKQMHHKYSVPVSPGLGL